MKVLAISLVVAGVLLPQQDQAERPVFRSGVNLVRVDVRIVDGAGRPIPDIRPDEIDIAEAGAKRPLLLFQRVAGAGGSYVEQAQKTIAADVSTNQGAPQGQLYVLVFDQDHIRSGGEQPVRIAADSFLRTRVKPQDRVAIFGLPGPGPSQPFTANMTSARHQLESVRGGLVRVANGAVTEMPQHDAYEILRGNEQVLTRYTTAQTGAQQAGGSGTDIARRTTDDPVVLRQLLRENAQSIVNRADTESRAFLAAFADLLRSFRGIDGRKTVLLFSEGFYSDNVSRDLENVAAAAAESYSVIYAFDLNKRATPVEAEAPANDATETISRLEPMGSLAAETSGALLKDASVRLDSALASLQPDDGSYYLLGFEPAAGSTDASAYRRIKVNVRRPGARVLTRTGYALGAAPSPADRRRAIDTALAAPFTQQSLKIEYTTYVGQSLAGGTQRVVMSLMAELPVRPSASANRSDQALAADVVFAVRDVRTGRTLASGSDQLPLPDQPRGGWSTGASPWHVAFELPAGEYIMRCVVREPGGIVGSADRRFTVRSLNGADVSATDFIIASPGDPLPVRAVAYTEGNLTGTLRLYAPALLDLGSATAHLELASSTEGTQAGTSRTSVATIAEAVTVGSRSMRDVLFAMPLSDLEPGQYVARAVVRVKGEIVADLRRPVEVIRGAAPAAAVSRPDSRRASAVLDGEIAKRLSVRAPASDGDPVRRGLAALGREQYAEAAASLETAFDAKPDDAALAFVLGWARAGAGDRTGAITAFRNAALLEPTMIPAHLALADTYVALGHPALAIQAVEAGLKAVPQSVELTRLLATIKK
jgi:VWFA-related protein